MPERKRADSGAVEPRGDDCRTTTFEEANLSRERLALSALLPFSTPRDLVESGRSPFEGTIIAFFRGAVTDIPFLSPVRIMQVADRSRCVDDVDPPLGTDIVCRYTP